jgi:Icc-related predicted phosphoesterase
MRILAFTDIHGAFGTIEEILSKESAFDLILIGGDLTTHGTSRQAEQAIGQFRRFGKPLLAVAGNMDSPATDDIFMELGISLNGKGVVIDGVGFFGVSGSPFTPMNTPYEISEEEIGKRAEAGWQQVETARWKVFAPHAPPRDTKLDKIFLGKHVGSSAVREFVEKRQPDLVICGHIHEARGIDTLGKSKMVNCGPAGRGYYAVAEIGDEVTIQLQG